MKKNFLLMALLTIALLVTGCSGGRETLAANAAGTATKVAPGGPSLAGTWKVSMEAPEASDDPMSKMAEGFGQMFSGMLELDFPDEQKFRMLVMGMPVEGDVSRSGNDLTLTPKTFLGLTFEEARKQGMLDKAQGVEDMEKPLKGTINQDGSKITLQPEGESQEPMVFVRKVTEPEKPVAEKVTSAEKKLVGDWKGRVEAGSGANLSEEQKQEVVMAQAMMSGTSLKLRADNTFAMKMMFDIEGTWKLANDKLVLTPTKMMGMEGGAVSGESMSLKVSGDGRVLTIEDEGPGGSKMHFDRA
jgi:hypothetical protein